MKRFLILSFCTLLAFEAMVMQTTSQAAEKPIEKKPADEISNPKSKRLPVILDTDIGDDVDDAWALTMLLKNPKLDLKLVTTTAGKSEFRAKVIAKLLVAAGRTDIPIGLGAGGRDETGSVADWVKDYSLKDFPGKIHEDGVKALVETVNGLAKEKTPVTVIAIGPLQTLEAALQLDPDIAKKTDFVGMHGSVRKGYEGDPKPCVEFNMCYVPGAQKVFTTRWKKITITPLDTCGLVRLTGENFKSLKASKDPLLVALMENYRLWAKKKSLDELNESSILFDTVAIYLAEPGPKPLLELEPLHIVVSDDGLMHIDPQGLLMSTATDWKKLAEYEDYLTKTLNSDTVKTPTPTKN
jgi:inosine-uridine nucleoside N-ribohydrolase